MRKLLLTILLLLPTLPLTVQAGQGLTALPEKAPAPDFELNDMDGKSHHLADYRGRVVIINFWATWCPPCRAEMPSMQRAWEQLSQEEIQMLAINVAEDEERISQFSSDYPVEFPLLMDLDSKVSEAWPLRGFPTTFIVDAEGRIAYQAIGQREWDDPELLALIRALQE